jgi:hypothetical protein
MYQHVAKWQLWLDTAVPLGSRIQTAQAWGERRGIAFHALEQQKQLYAVAERVPETGAVRKLECSEWSVILKITFSSSGLSEKNEVFLVGSYL